MLKDHKGLMYGGGLFAGAVIIVTNLPLGELVCVSPHLMCAPPPIHMADEQSGHEPQPLHLPKLAAASASSTVSTVQLSGTAGIRLGARGALGT